MLLARGLGIVAWHLSGSYRRLVGSNLEIAFGGGLAPGRKADIGREHFARLAANIAAGACLSRQPGERLREWVDIEGLEHLREAQARGKGVVGLLGHIGNWEMLARLSPGLFACPCGSVYQSLSNPFVDRWVRSQRALEGLALFERREGFNGALEMLRAGGVVGVLADQHAGDRGLWCPFFNRLASTSPLVATMALRTGAAVLGIALYTQPGGRWRLVIRPPLTPESRDSAAFTAQVNLELEHMIRMDPADWLWSHNRWKTPKPKFLGIGGKRGIFAHPKLQPFRLLVRSVNWLGDAVMTVPSIRALRRTRPDLEITVACQRKLAGFWSAVPEVDRVLEIPPGGGIRDTARLYAKERFDAVIVHPNSLRTGLEVWLAGIPRRVGYGGHWRGKLLNQVFQPVLPIKKEPLGRHQVHHYLDLAEFVGAPRLEPSEWLAVRPPLVQDAEGCRRKIAVCPGAEFGPAKRWLPERFAEVMHQVSLSREVEWYLVGVSKDAPAGEAIEAALAGLKSGAQLVNQIGRTGLGELMKLLSRCDLLLTNDTGTMHLAAMLGVPVVAVFGSTDPVLTGPLGPGHIVLQRKVPCGPCFQRECHLDFACMRGVESREAASAVEEMLNHGFFREKGSRALES
jgi:lipopolysaccharide heptosyltransferase II